MVSGSSKGLLALGGLLMLLGTTSCAMAASAPADTNFAFTVGLAFLGVGLLLVVVGGILALTSRQPRA